MSVREKKTSINDYWNSLSHCYSEAQLAEAFLPFRKSIQISQVFEGYLGFVDTRTKRSILNYGECEEVTGFPLLFFATDPVARIAESLAYPARKEVNRILDQMVRLLHVDKTPLTDLLEITLIGVELLVNKNAPKKVLVRMQPVLHDPEGSLAVISLILKDITHLTNLQDPWCRMVDKKGEKYFANRDTCKKGDIFSPRELEVLSTLQQRKSNDYIARKLGISYNTVLVHQKSMMQKLGTIDRSSLLHLSGLVGLV